MAISTEIVFAPNSQSTAFPGVMPVGQDQSGAIVGLVPAFAALLAAPPAAVGAPAPVASAIPPSSAVAVADPAPLRAGGQAASPDPLLDGLLILADGAPEAASSAGPAAVGDGSDPLPAATPACPEVPEEPAPPLDEAITPAAFADEADPHPAPVELPPDALFAALVATLVLGAPMGPDPASAAIDHGLHAPAAMGPSSGGGSAGPSALSGPGPQLPVHVAAAVPAALPAAEPGARDPGPVPDGGAVIGSAASEAEPSPSGLPAASRPAPSSASEPLSLRSGDVLPSRASGAVPQAGSATPVVPIVDAPSSVMRTSGESPALPPSAAEPAVAGLPVPAEPGPQPARAVPREAPVAQTTGAAQPIAAFTDDVLRVAGAPPVVGAAAKGKDAVSGRAQAQSRHAASPAPDEAASLQTPPSIGTPVPPAAPVHRRGHAAAPAAPAAPLQPSPADAVAPLVKPVVHDPSAEAGSIVDETAPSGVWRADPAAPPAPVPNAAPQVVPLPSEGLRLRQPELGGEPSTGHPGVAVDAVAAVPSAPSASAPARMEQAAPLPTANPVERMVVRQVSRALVRGTPSGDRSLVIRLTPPELGTVRIEFIERDGAVTARIHADDPAVRQALDRLLPQVRGELRAADSPVQQITVSAGSSSDQAFDGRGFDGRGAQQHQQRQESAGAGGRSRRGDRPAFSLDGGSAPIEAAAPSAPRPRISDSIVDALA